jgi:hypothetical protein
MRPIFTEAAGPVGICQVCCRIGRLIDPRERGGTMRVIAAAGRVASNALVRLVFGLALLAAAPAWGQRRESGDLYDTATLQEWQARYTRSMNRILAEGFVPVLSAEERRVLAGVKLDFPLRDEAFLNFYTEGQTIVLPVAALHWLSEIYTSYAWLVLKNYRLEPIEEYVAMLKHKKPQDFPDGAYPTPLRALGIPATALEDANVDGLSLRLFNSARAFILAHELGHVNFHHEGSDLRHEEEADRFALELMRRTKTIPMGVSLYFQATALWFEGGPPSHPLNAKRLRAMATQLGAMARDFGAGSPDDVERVRFIGRGLEQVAEYLDDAELQRCVATSAARANPAVLRPRAQGTPSILDCVRRR